MNIKDIKSFYINNFRLNNICQFCKNSFISTVTNVRSCKHSRSCKSRDSFPFWSPTDEAKLNWDKYCSNKIRNVTKNRGAIKIIIINGSGGCGKSTFIEKCQAMSSENQMVIECSTVDYPKEIATICGWDGRKEEKDRAFLHDLKMALQNWNNSPNTYVFDQMCSLATLYSSKDMIFFVNIREPASIEAFKEQLAALAKDAIFPQYNIYTTLVENPRVAKITSNEGDASVDNYNYDIKIINDSTLKDLEEKAKNFINNIV